MLGEFRLDAFDSELSRRMSASEWRRTSSFRDHPLFLKALFRNDELIPALFSHNPMLNKVVTEAWRFEMLVYSLHLHDTRDPADPRTGLTISRLQALCARQECASRGRVFAVLGIMRIAGYLKARRSSLDSRVTHLEPSPEFVGVVEVLEPGHSPGYRRRDARGQSCARPSDYPRFGWDMRERGAQALIAGWKLLDPFPEVMHFVSRDGGWMLLIRIVADALRASGGREIAPVSIPLTKFAETFHVSRSHSWRLLGSAHAAGLLTERSAGQVVPSPLLVASYLACLAAEMSHYRQWALETQQALADKGEGRLAWASAPGRMEALSPSP